MHVQNAMLFERAYGNVILKQLLHAYKIPQIIKKMNQNQGNTNVN